MMLLGCVFLRAGQKIEWDGPKNCLQAAPFLRSQDAWIAAQKGSPAAAAGQ